LFIFLQIKDPRLTGVHIRMKRLFTLLTSPSEELRNHVVHRLRHYFPTLPVYFEITSRIKQWEQLFGVLLEPMASSEHCLGVYLHCLGWFKPEPLKSTDLAAPAPSQSRVVVPFQDPVHALRSFYLAWQATQSKVSSPNPRTARDEQPISRLFCVAYHPSFFWPWVFHQVASAVQSQTCTHEVALQQYIDWVLDPAG
jgi:hypothetical protein